MVVQMFKEALKSTLEGKIPENGHYEGKLAQKMKAPQL